MIIVADASPLISLNAIGRLSLLNKLFGEIYVTDIVAKEAGDELPEWIHITTEYERTGFQVLSKYLDPGEASAIQLCLDNQDCTLIIDERKGRKTARDAGIKIVGLLGVVVLAHKEEIIDDASELLDAIIANGFRISEKIESIIRAAIT